MITNKNYDAAVGTGQQVDCRILIEKSNGVCRLSVNAPICSCSENIQTVCKTFCESFRLENNTVSFTETIRCEGRGDVPSIAAALARLQAELNVIKMIAESEAI